jgi:hypothetical protein
MSLSMYPLYLSCVKQFTSSTSDNRFKGDFVDASNSVMDDLSNNGKLTTALPHIESVNDTVDDLDSTDSSITLKGLIYYLVLLGQKHVRGDDAYAFATSEWEDALGEWRQLLLEEDMSTRDDDGIPEADIIGLGYLGD